MKREYDVSESYIEYNGHPGVILSLEMIEGNNIVQYGKDVQQVMDEYVATRLPDDVTVQRITDHVQDSYDRVLGWTFRHPWLTICGGVATVILFLVLIGPQLKIRMMPTADRNQFAVEISLPQGKGLAETRATTSRPATSMSMPTSTIRPAS